MREQILIRNHHQEQSSFYFQTLFLVLQNICSFLTYFNNQVVLQRNDKLSERKKGMLTMMTDIKSPALLLMQDTHTLNVREANATALLPCCEEEHSINIFQIKMYINI